MTIGDDLKASAAKDDGSGVPIKTDSQGRFQASQLTNTDKTPTGIQSVQAPTPSCSPELSYRSGVF